MALVDDENDDEVVALLVDVADKLEMCEFVGLWALLESEHGIALRSVSGFMDSIRSFIATVLAATHTV